MIRQGDFVRLDLWAKADGPESVYADLMWTSFLGSAARSRHVEVFEVVRVRGIGVWTLRARPFERENH